jgi:DHA1 family bicyclomycin/chloramphenicol resistance-like MFS transporter
VTGFGVAGLLVSSAALLGICLAGMFTAGLAVPLLFLNAAATGLAMPGAVQGAMQPFPLMAGTASAVQGCFRMFGAAVSSALVAALTDGTPVAMALVMTVFASAGGLVWWGTTMRFGWRMPIAAPTEPKVE